MKKILTPILILVFIFTAGISITYSAYINQSYVKAVITTNETEKLFASNLLYGIKSIPTENGEYKDITTWANETYYSIPREVYENANITEITIPIKIYNYLKEDNTLVNLLDVYYNLEINITGDRELEGYRYRINNGNDIEITNKSFNINNQVLKGRIANENVYYITIPKKDLGKVSFYIKAERLKDSSGRYGTDLACLAAKVTPSLDASVQETSIERSGFTNVDTNPADLAAYTYRLVLDGAPTAITLIWDKNLVELDPAFEAKYGFRPNGNTVTFDMNPGTMEIQFYRKDDAILSNYEDILQIEY